MSFFRWGGKKNKNKDTPAVTTASYTQSHTGDTPQHSADGASQEGEVKNVSAAVRRDRNLSISRSGRHKVKKNGRATVMTGEFYSTPQDNGAPPQQTSASSSGGATAPTGAAWGPSSGVGAGGSQGGAHNYCRDTGSNSSRHGLSGSQRMHHASQPTAV